MLKVDISINGAHLISSIEVKRIAPNKPPVDDDVCTYAVGRIFDNEVKISLGKVEHRYGDGAEALAAKAILLVSQHELSAIEEEVKHRLVKLSRTFNI